MDNKEQLKSMLNNFINDRQAEASMDLHNYLTSKMREVSGIAPAQASESGDDDAADAHRNEDVA